MATFSIAFLYLLGNEDYPPDDPRYGQVTTDNNGGLVRFGINSDGEGKDLLTTGYYSTMSVADAYKVASNLYNTTNWAAMHGDDLHSQRVASKILDLSVNSGTVESAKISQRAANVNVDGAIGPITIAAINNLDENVMLQGLVTWWNWLITQILDNNPKDLVYEKEWRARANKLPNPVEGILE
jgi:lysozyme family protein